MPVTSNTNAKQTQNYSERACIAEEGLKCHSTGKLDFLKKPEYQAVSLGERKMDDSS